MIWRSEFSSDSLDKEHIKHLQEFDDACLKFYTVTLFKIIFTHMLYEEDKNSNTFNHLGFCVTSKHAQIGLIDVTSEIHTIY